MDISRWNLFTSGVGLAVAVIACGPATGTEESDSADATASTGTSDASDTNSTQGADCLSDVDCGYGYACIDNVCERQTCYCGGCGQPPPPGFDVRCPGGIAPYYDCNSDYDCGEGEICSYHECQPGPDPIDCSGIPLTAQTIALEFATPSEAPVVALAFADVAEAAGAELLVARGNTIEAMAEGGVGTVIVQTAADVAAFAAADLDGDTLIDLVTTEYGDTAALRLWQGEMGGTFAATALSQPLVDARALAIGDREGDMQPDIYAHVGRDVLVFPTTAGVPLGVAQLLLVDQVDAMALIDIAGDGVSDVAFGQGNVFWLYRELQSPEPMSIGDADGEIIDVLVAADFSGDAEPELAGIAGPAALSTFIGPVPTGGWIPFALTDGGYTAATAGDIDGDGRQDLVILEPQLGNVLVRYGADVGTPEAVIEPYRCNTRYAIEVVGQRIAAGDSDGDGRAELAVADGAQVVLVRI